MPPRAQGPNAPPPTPMPPQGTGAQWVLDDPVYRMPTLWTDCYNLITMMRTILFNMMCTTQI